MKKQRHFFPNIRNKGLFSIGFLILIYVFSAKSQEIHGKYILKTSGTLKYLTIADDSLYKYRILSDMCDQEYTGRYKIKDDTLTLDTAVGKTLPLKYVFENKMFLREAKAQYEYSNNVIILHSFYEFKKIEGYYTNGTISMTMSWFNISTPNDYQCDRRPNGEWIYYNKNGVIIKKETYKKGKLKKTLTF